MTVMLSGTGMEDTEEGTEAMADMAMATMGTTARGSLINNSLSWKKSLALCDNNEMEH